MSNLDGNAYALLELLALKPLSVIPPMHLSLAERLKAEGLTTFQSAQWHPTANGLRAVGHTLH
ncbi:MAG: hypothetical protein KKB37_14185 [Alphaproteobacteria bacterium]|nr:hypothetical protein [Alphaproteobacteria bacterium]